MKLDQKLSVWIVLWGLLLAVPLITSSGRWIDFLELTLFAALLGQGWNILGGYGGQYSFGNALFFGTAAYIQALLQFRYGLSPWVTIAPALAGAVLIASFLGYLSFRYGLRGSYFALITLAFAEAFHVLSRSLIGLTEGGRGVQVTLNQDPERAIASLQFTFAGEFLREYGFYYMILLLFFIACVVTFRVQGSRFGAQLIAIRENEDASAALGINAFAVKMKAICLSAVMTGSAGIYYVQKFLFVDPGIAFGAGKSVEALFAAIIGGLGTVFGPLVGALFIHGVGEIAKELMGLVWEVRPGIDLILFGIILVLVLGFLPRGLVGLLEKIWVRIAARVKGGRHA